MVRHQQHEQRTKTEVGYKVRKRDGKTQGSINNPGTEIRVKYDYTVILGIRVMGKKDGGSTRFGNS